VVNDIKFVKRKSLSNDIVIIDGFSGSGKSLIAPLVTSLERAELWLAEYTLDLITIAHYHGKINSDAASMMLKSLSDYALYNHQIGRLVNFRAFDDSSAQKNEVYDEYMKRMQNPIEKDNIKEQIFAKRPIQVFMTHYLFGYSDILFEGLGDRLKLFIVMFRHPASLINSWYNTGMVFNIGKDERDITPFVECGKYHVPWYAAQWAESYEAVGPVEKCIRTIYELYEKKASRLKALSAKNKEKVLFVPFEQFTQDYDSFLDKIKRILGTEGKEKTKKVIKKFDLPRSIPVDTIPNALSELYGRMDEEKVGSESRRMLEWMREDYKVKYGC